jgi:hypothetical protein
MTAKGGVMERDQDEGDLRREGERIAQLIDDVGAMAGAPVASGSRSW